LKSRIGKTVELRGEEYVTCEEVLTYLLDYLSRELTPEESIEFERHLSICPSCVSYLKTYKEAVRLGRDAMQGADEKPPELGPTLLQAILSARR
jgi:anti-sigma factor RsiW